MEDCVSFSRGLRVVVSLVREASIEAPHSLNLLLQDAFTLQYSNPALHSSLPLFYKIQKMRHCGFV